MRKPKLSEKTYKFSYNGETIEVYCWTTYGKNVSEIKSLGIKGIYTYCNRPWQNFTFDCSLLDLAKKADKISEELGKKVRELHGQIRDEVYKECDEMEKNFMSAYNALSPERKEQLSNSGTFINSMKEAKAVTAELNMLNIMDSFK